MRRLPAVLYLLPSLATLSTGLTFLAEFSEMGAVFNSLEHTHSNNFLTSARRVAGSDLEI
jgi:hypothetical protein